MTAIDDLGVETAVEASIPPRKNRMPSKGRRRALVVAIQLALLALILILWEWASGPAGEPGTIIDEYYISSPSGIAEALGNFAQQGVLLDSILATTQVTLVGFAVGAFLGFVAGVLLGANRFLARVLSPFISALYSIPRLALIPLFILWLGIGIESKIALVASIVFFLVFYATYAGVRDVDQSLIDKMRLMRATRWSVFTKATMPSAASFIIDGLSISGPFALVTAVAAEMFSSNRGLGYLLVRSSSQFQTDGVFACLFILMIMGIILMAAIRLLEGWLLRWKPDRVDAR